MPVTTNTRKLAALLGASGAGIGTDGLLQAAAVDANLATQAELDAIPVYDDVSVRQDITTLALRQAIGDNNVAYNLPDSFIDIFQDDSGIGTETDTDRNASEYMETTGGTTADSPTTIPSSSSDWNGSTANFTYASGTVTAAAGDKAVYADWESGTNDYLVQFTLTARANCRIAMFETEHVGDFNENNRHHSSYWCPSESSNG